MKQVRFGILGAANIAIKFHHAVSLTKDGIVTAISSRSNQRAEEFAIAQGIPKHYGSYSEMLESDEIDAVYIATTQNTHYEHIKESLLHGKHVLCEKSMVPTAAEAKELFALAKEKNLLLMEAMWSRFLPHVVKAKEWIDTGMLGDIALVEATIGFKHKGPPDDRIFNPALGGGAMLDIGVYNIELVTFLIQQEILAVKSFLSYTKTGVDGVNTILLRFEHCLATLTSTVIVNVREHISVYGTNGSLTIPRVHGENSAILYDANRNPVEKFNQPVENGFLFEVEEFISLLQQGKIESKIIPSKDTILCAEIFDECFKNGTPSQL